VEPSIGYMSSNLMSFCSAAVENVSCCRPTPFALGSLVSAVSS